MIDPKTVSSELEDSALKRAQAKSDMADANEAIQHAQNALGDAQRRFLAHDAVVQALTTLLTKPKTEAPNAIDDPRD